MTKNEREYRGKEQQENKRQQQRQEYFENQIVNSVGPDLSIPFESKQYGEHFGNQEHPALFGQNQLKNDLGPVYAIPTFPWEQGDVSVQRQVGLWQSGHGQHADHVQWQPWSNSQPTMWPPCHCICCLAGYRRYW